MGGPARGDASTRRCARVGEVDSRERRLVVLDQRPGFTVSSATRRLTGIIFRLHRSSGMMRHAWAVLGLGLWLAGVQGGSLAAQTPIGPQQNRSNPFNPATTIPFKVSGELFLKGHRPVVSLRIYRSEERRVGKECRTRWPP